MGKLEINVVPCDEEGEMVSEDDIPDEPEELIEKRIDFKVEIKRAFNLPNDHCKDVFCEYSIFLGDEKFTTNFISGKCQEPEFNYTYQHTVEPVTEYFIQYLKNESVSFLPIYECIVVYQSLWLPRHEGNHLRC